MMKRSLLSIALMAFSLVAHAEPQIGPGPRGARQNPNEKKSHGNPPPIKAKMRQPESIRVACRKHGLTPKQIEMLLAVAKQANEESLPVDCVLIKIEEGLAKKVAAEQITIAAQERLKNLRTARNLLSGVESQANPKKNPPRLLQCTCMALESGLSEIIISNVVNRSETTRPGRLIPVIEAGETLHLAGLAPEAIQQILTDCIDRDLNRYEIQRVVKIILTRHQAGIPFETIHRALWLNRTNPSTEKKDALPCDETKTGRVREVSTRVLTLEGETK